MTRRPLTLFARLVLLALPVEALVLLLFGLWLIPWTERRGLDALDLNLKVQKNGLLSRATFDAAGQLEAPITGTAVEPGVSASILDEKGRVLWESPDGWYGASGLRPSTGAGLETLLTVKVGGKRCRVLDAAHRLMTPQDTEPEFASGPIVEVVLAKPLASLEESNREFRLKAAGVGGALLLLTAALLFWSLRVGLSPIGRLTRRLHDVPGPAGMERLDEHAVPEELRPLAREINGLLDRLWGLVELEKRFAAEAAHELRTPLTLVKSTLQTAQLTVKRPEEYRGALQDALDDLERLEKTAETLLGMVREESLHARSMPPLEAVGLPDLLKGAARKFGAAAKERSLELVLDCRPCEVRGDRESLERLVACLLDNAVKYARAGGRIVLRCGAEREGALLWVEDGGPAIPKEERPHLFRHFYRGSSGRLGEVAGAGLGLAIAREIARLHGADLAHEYSGEEGNRFVVRFSRGRTEP